MRISGMIRKPTVYLGASVLVVIIFIGLLGGAHAATPKPLHSIAADRNGSACASIPDDSAHIDIGIGIAFNGTSLLLSCFSDSTIVEIDPADGTQIATHSIDQADLLGALAWDSVNSVLWACSSIDEVGTIDLATDEFTHVFDSNGCVSGLAYDAATDTLWTSGDTANTVEHYTSDGTLISSESIAGLLGSCGSTGLVVAGTHLYLSNGGCSQVFAANEDLTETSLWGQVS